MNYDSMSNKYIEDFSTVFCVVGVALFQLFTYLDVISIYNEFINQFRFNCDGNRCSLTCVLKTDKIF